MPISINAASCFVIPILLKYSFLSLSYVDLINVMTYDLYGSWTNKIGHHSALFHRRGEKGLERDLNTVC